MCASSAPWSRRSTADCSQSRPFPESSLSPARIRCPNDREHVLRLGPDLGIRAGVSGRLDPCVRLVHEQVRQAGRGSDRWVAPAVRQERSDARTGHRVVVVPIEGVAQPSPWGTYRLAPARLAVRPCLAVGSPVPFGQHASHDNRPPRAAVVASHPSGPRVRRPEVRLGRRRRRRRPGAVFHRSLGPLARERRRQRNPTT